MAYDEFLKRSLHKSADCKTGGSIEVRFRHMSDGKEQHYSVLREWKMNGTKIRESLRILQNENFDKVMTDAWEEHVEQFIPLQISNLFFFDGEKVKELAELKKSADLLSTGIHSLLGLNLVDRLSTDLNVLERRKKENLRQDQDYQQIERDKAEIRKLEEKRDDLYQKLGADQNRSDKLKLQLEALEERFRLEGGELYKSREHLASEREMLKSRIDEMENSLRNIAAGPAPFLLVPDLLKSVEKQARSESRNRQSEIVNRVLAERDELLLAELHSRKIAKKTLALVESVLSEDRNRRSLAGKSKSYLELNDESKDRLTHLMNTVLPETRKKLSDLLEMLEQERAALEDTDRRLAMIPDEDALHTLIREMENLRSNLNDSEKTRQISNEEYEKCNREIGVKKARLIRQIESAVDEAFEQENNARIIYHSQKVRKTIEKFRSSFVQRNIERIEKLVLESFMQLFRKKSLIGEIQIDPDDFSVRLKDSHGRELLPERLSAGERQLLAVSLLWGLAKASGRSLPAIIDTPLGRLDASHRMHLIERYFPFASHQVILLSTDEEISESYYEKLKPRIGRSYRLHFDESSESTTVQEGYFW
jgi:DNA sulfur modification protein DndD